MPKTQATEGAERLYTLSEVSKLTNISMPTLQRYKKNYQSRIPSVGKGRRQRYPEEALPVFQQIKEENIAKRGRPRKSATKKPRRRTPPPKKKGAARRGRKPAAAAAARSGGLMTLTEVAKKAGVSYPTAVRYVKLHGSELPYEGAGRRKRFHPQAVEVVKRLRRETSRGRKAKATKPAARRRASTRGRGRKAAAATGSPTGAEKRIKALEKSHAQLEKRFKALVERLRKPRRVI